MDILKVIVKDHREAKKLLKKLKSGADDSSADLDSVKEEFITAMRLHAKSEEAALYKMCQLRNVKLRDFALEGYNEHKLLDVMLGKLVNLEPGENGEFKAAISVLEELIEHHAEEEEEKEMFPKIKKAFSDEEREEMGRFMIETKQRLQSKGAVAARPAKNSDARRQAEPTL